MDLFQSTSLITEDLLSNSEISLEKLPAHQFLRAERKIIEQVQYRLEIWKNIKTWSYSVNIIKFVICPHYLYNANKITYTKVKTFRIQGPNEANCLKKVGQFIITIN